MHKTGEKVLNIINHEGEADQKNVRYHHIPIRLAPTKSKGSVVNTGESRSVSWNSHCEKSIEVLKKLKISLECLPILFYLFTLEIFETGSS